MLLAALVDSERGLVGLAHVTTVAHVMVQAVAMGIGGGFVMVVFFSFWGRAYGPAQLGRIQGAAQAMTVLASAVGPLLLALSRRCDRVVQRRVLLAGRRRGAARRRRARWCRCRPASSPAARARCRPWTSAGSSAAA